MQNTPFEESPQKHIGSVNKAQKVTLGHPSPGCLVFDATENPGPSLFSNVTCCK